jgi:hypothetical protein
VVAGARAGAVVAGAGAGAVVAGAGAGAAGAGAGAEVAGAGAAAGAAAFAGLIMPQPMRSGGARPCSERAKVCGTSGARSGKCAAISGGGVGSVFVAGQTTTAPLS